MPYVARKPNAFDAESLRATIPGWGVDADPQTRPGIPRERPPEPANGDDRLLPERQPERSPRERSIEHAMLTPVFGTVCPPRGLSGAIRRLAYAKFSEGQSAHWLLLMLGDRVDVLESMVGSALRLRPDNPLAEMGLKAELKGHPLRSRIGQHRVDVKHQPLDVLMFLGKGALLAGAAVALTRMATRPKRRGLLALLTR